MEWIAAQLSSEADDIVLPDDLCAPLMGTADRHCHLPSVRYRDERAIEDISGYLGSPISAGTVLPIGMLSGLRSALSAGTIRTACAGCPWAELCTAIANAEFAQTQLCFRDTADERQ